MHSRIGVPVFYIATLSVTASAVAQPVLSVLATLTSPNGQEPFGGLIADASGNLFGTADYGGTGHGTVFKVAVGTDALSTLIAFNGSNGTTPQGTLIADAVGNFYGTTYQGGLNNDGTIFRIAAGTNTLTTLASFNGSNGSGPYVGLIADASGKLYGTTYKGGTNNDGTVFMVNAATGTVSTLANFNGSNGSTPAAKLVLDATGNLYGTTSAGGAHNCGTVFEISAGTNAFSTLQTFNGSNGQMSLGGLLADGTGNLYGTTFVGGSSGDGIVFEIAAHTHAFVTLATLNSADGDGPETDLIADAAGNLYGTTTAGGLNGDGTVFEVAAGSDVISTLASFSVASGYQPRDGLYADASGNLYGTTSNGGATYNGTVFELTNTGFVVAIPEPGGLALASIASIALLGRRRFVSAKF